MMNGTTEFQVVLFLIHATAAFCMMIGYAIYSSFWVLIHVRYRTKLATFITWFMVVSMQARNNLIGHGGDVYTFIYNLFH